MVKLVQRAVQARLVPKERQEPMSLDERLLGPQRCRRFLHEAVASVECLDNVGEHSLSLGARGRVEAIARCRRPRALVAVCPGLTGGSERISIAIDGDGDHDRVDRGDVEPGPRVLADLARVRALLR